MNERAGTGEAINIARLQSSVGSGLGRPGNPPTVRHPAIERFENQVDPRRRLIVVRSPDGTGKQWFAESWCGDGAAARVLRWDPRAERTDAIIGRVRACTEAEPNARFAVVAGATAPVVELIAAVESTAVGPQDLLLREPEIQRHAPACGAGGPTASELFRPSGGWLDIVDRLAADPLDLDAARRALIGPLARWLSARDPQGTMAATAFLTHFTESAVQHFEPVVGHAGQVLGDMVDAGLLRHDDGELFMPELVQRCVQDLVRERSPEGAQRLSRLATIALAESEDALIVADRSARTGAWSTLQQILLERWADLFVAGGHRMARLAERVPRHVRGRLSEVGFGLRVLAHVGPDRMELGQPTVAPDYARDRMAGRLREMADAAYRRPGNRAVLVGVLEVTYLRQAGHYQESAEAAGRARRALAAATLEHRVPRSAASLAELQAGISFHLADRLAEAQLAYEAALYAAGGTGYLRAEALAKLALVAAHRGQTHTARLRLAELQAPLSKVGWGKPMVARFGELARVIVALHAFDFEEARAILENLPAEPDNDEMWAVHASLLALVRAVRGDASGALGSLEGLLEERPYASQAPLAERMLSEARALVGQLMGSTEPDPDRERSPLLALLEGVRRLRVGDADGALAVLPEHIGANTRLHNLAWVLRALASEGELDRPPSGRLLDVVRRMREGQFELLDLLPVSLLGGVQGLLDEGVVSADEARRLRSLPGLPVAADSRPHLTPRERELLDLLREGLTRREMAERTFRSENTIKGQLRTLYAKLDARSAPEAVERARLLGL